MVFVSTLIQTVPAGRLQHLVRRLTVRCAALTRRTRQVVQRDAKLVRRPCGGRETCKALNNTQHNKRKHITIATPTSPSPPPKHIKYP